MYNGSGPQTARGFGTNGCFQTNNFFIWTWTESPPRYGGGRAGAGTGALSGMRSRTRKSWSTIGSTMGSFGCSCRGTPSSSISVEIQERVEEAGKEDKIEAAACVVVEAVGHGDKAPSARLGEGYGSTNRLSFGAAGGRWSVSALFIFLVC